MEMQQMTTEMKDYEEALMEDMEDAIDHGILVSILASGLARELNREEEFCTECARAGLVHDIGKLRLAEYLYGRRRDTLKVEEMKYIRMHSTLGYETLRDKCLYSEEILDGIHHHHENYDGSGYPSNLKADAIPYMARILRICDVFAALVSERPYRPAFDMETAVEMMIDEVKNFDMSMFVAFLKMVNRTDMDRFRECVEQINEKVRSRSVLKRGN